MSFIAEGISLTHRAEILKIYQNTQKNTYSENSVQKFD